MTDIIRYAFFTYAMLLIALWVLAEFRVITWGTATAPCRYTIPLLKAGLTAAGFCA